MDSKKGVGIIFVVVGLILLIVITIATKTSGNNLISSNQIGINNSENSLISTEETERTLSNGFYIVGEDIEIGNGSVEVVSGNGSLIIDNEGIMLGTDTISGQYKQVCDNIDFKKDSKIQITQDLVVNITYSKIEKKITERQYDEEKGKELLQGTYIVGEDIEPGVYNIEISSGAGNFTCSNKVDEFLGNGIEKIKNLNLKQKDTITINGNLSVKIIPEIKKSESEDNNTKDNDISDIKIPHL